MTLRLRHNHIDVTTHEIGILKREIAHLEQILAYTHTKPVARGLYRERSGWRINTVPTSNMTKAKNSTCQRIATGQEVISRHSMNCLGKMRPRTMRRGCVYRKPHSH